MESDQTQYAGGLFYNGEARALPRGIGYSNVNEFGDYCVYVPKPGDTWGIIREQLDLREF